VRAFGCLLEELIERCDASLAMLADLVRLQAACVQAAPPARPLFDEIEQRLSALQQQNTASATLGA
jgi:hypothetical protein